MQPIKMGKFATSLAIVRQSWAILKQDKEIMLFPIVSVAVSGIALGIMGLLYVFVILGSGVESVATSSTESVPSDPWQYLALFLYYIVMCFIVYFFEACIFLILE